VSVEGFGWVASQRREHTREGWAVCGKGIQGEGVPGWQLTTCSGKILPCEKDELLSQTVSLPTRPLP
jgi:hypothetical protein